MAVPQSARSRWSLKAGGSEPVYEQPRADPYVSSNYDAQGQQITNVRYPITVTDHPNSDYVRCYYSAERFDMCEKTYGCCSDGCCPKDEWWMAGVYVLIAFVIAVAIIAVIIGVICYKRGSEQKKKERMYYSGSSVAGSQPYGSDVGSHRSIAAPY